MTKSYRIITRIMDLPDMDYFYLNRLPKRDDFRLDLGVRNNGRVRALEALESDSNYSDKIGDNPNILFGSDYDRFYLNSEQRNELGIVLGLDKAEALIHKQVCGQIVTFHLDNVLTGYVNLRGDNELRDKLDDDEVLSLNNDPSLCARVFIFLDDHRLGQGMVFGDEVLSDWRRGDVLVFDHLNMVHGTFNVGYWDRFIIRLTGIKNNKFYEILDGKYPFVYLNR